MHIIGSKNKDINIDWSKELKIKSLDGYNCSIELYKLFERKTFINLIKNNISSDKEDVFIKNLNDYILFIENNYHFNYISLINIVEITIDNPYSEILYSLDNYENDYINKRRINYYRRMFLYNIINNIKYYSKMRNNNDYVRRFYYEIKKYSFTSDNDLLKIKSMIKRVINYNLDGIVNLFMSYKNEKQYDQLLKINNIFRNYYDYKIDNDFIICEDDNYIIVDGKSKLLFNICTNIDNLKNDDYVLVEFGILNSCFNYKVRDSLFRKRELLVLFSKLESIKFKNGKFNTNMNFINPTLKFNFWSDSTSYLDIEFSCNSGCDYYSISLNLEDIVNLYDILRKQLM